MGNELVPLTNAKQLGSVFADSGLFSDIRDFSQAAVKILAGRELGFASFPSMSGIYLVKGKVTLSANLIAAAIRKSGEYDYRIAKHTTTECTIKFFRDGEELGESSFTMEDAKQAGLAGSQTWKSYPRNMLFARAMSNGARWHTPDVFSGNPVYTPDEIDNTLQVDPESGDLKTVPAAVISVSPAALTDSRDRMMKLIEVTGANTSAILKHFQVGKLEELSEADVEATIGLLQQRVAVSQS